MFDVDLRVRFADTLILVVASPGPAGSITVSLLDGFDVIIDAKERGALVRIDIRRELLGEPALAELVGTQVVARLMEMEPPRNGRPLPVARQSAWEGSTLGPRTSRPSPNDPARRFGEAVRLLSKFDSSSKNVLVRLVGVLESFRAIDELEDFPGLSELLRTRVRDRLEQFEFDDDELSVLMRRLSRTEKHQLSSLVSHWLRSARRGLPGSQSEGVGRMELLLDQVDAEKRMLSGSGTDQSGVASRRPVIDRIEELAPSWIRVRFSGFRRDFWLRVIDRRTLQLITVVPILRVTADRSEAFVFTPGGDVEFVDFEITLTPLPQMTRVSSYLEASMLGRKAEDSESRGDVEAAGECWQACSELWGSLGEDRRAHLARTYAIGRGVKGAVLALADRIDDSTHLDL